MADLSPQKMQDIRKLKGYTYKQLAEITKIPHSTIAKVLGGINKNPSSNFLKAMAQALECEVSDFFEYEQEPTNPYYLDRKTGKLAQEIYDNRDLRILMDASKDLSPEDVKIIIDVANRLKKTKH